MSHEPNGNVFSTEGNEGDEEKSRLRFLLSAYRR
jgi:hypothetical protein